MNIIAQKRENTQKNLDLPDFNEASDQGKRRRIEKTIEANDPEQIALATALNFNRNGNHLASKIVKILYYSQADPEKTRRDLSIFLNCGKNKTTPEEALSKLISWNLSKSLYIEMSQYFSEFPSYDLVRQAKVLALPEHITITEKRCEVPLQSLLNHTASRLLKSLTLCDQVSQKLRLACKVGFDGSSGHSEYKQVWKEAGQNDSSIVISCLYPLQLENTQNDELIWRCRVHSSVYFNRVLSLTWTKENDDFILAEKKWIDDQIAKVRPFKQGDLEIKFRLMFTMADGKVFIPFQFYVSRYF